MPRPGWPVPGANLRASQIAHGAERLRQVEALERQLRAARSAQATLHELERDFDPEVARIPRTRAFLAADSRSR